MLQRTDKERSLADKERSNLASGGHDGRVARALHIRRKWGAERARRGSARATVIGAGFSSPGTAFPPPPRCMHAHPCAAACMLANTAHLNRAPSLVADALQRARLGVVGGGADSAGFQLLAVRAQRVRPPPRGWPARPGPLPAPFMRWMGSLISTHLYAVSAADLRVRRRVTLTCLG